MGWNSWNWHGKMDINEKIVRETIDAIVESGLKDAGYNYVIIDGGWRDVKTGPNGELLPHPVKFPGGIKPLADYAHIKGLKFGLHVVPGTHDCGGDPVGGFNREEVHLRQFLEWGVDFIKLDLCRQAADPCINCAKDQRGWSEETLKETYIKWSTLLKNCGRDILFSISAYQFRDWNPDYCNMSRTTQDIKARIHGGAIFDSPSRENTGFLSVMTTAELNNISANAAGNGYWNDPDMMVTGDHGLSKTEQESHFALWCIMSSPLFLGNDPRIMSQDEKELVTNIEMITINQDPTCQGKKIKTSDNTQVWAKELVNGNIAILFLNLNAAKKSISINLAELGLSGKIRARDVINGKDLGNFKRSITVQADTHQGIFMLLSK